MDCKSPWARYFLALAVLGARIVVARNCCKAIFGDLIFDDQNGHKVSVDFAPKIGAILVPKFGTILLQNLGPFLGF